MNKAQTPNTGVVLELQNISKSYRTSGGQQLQVLSDVSLTVSAQQMVAIVGQSGSGKSTLLHVAGLLDTADSGIILLNGTNFSTKGDAERSAARNQHMGFVYQHHHLLPDFTALENVLMPLRIGGKVNKEHIDRAKEILKELKMEHRFEHLPGQLSGGEQQRVAIARAVVHLPKLVLADEPTGNLDPATADEAFAMFTRLAEQTGVALVMVTHNPELAQRCHKRFHMHNGGLVEV